MIDSLEDLNNPNSDIFKATLKNQTAFIDKKLEKWSKKPTKWFKSNAFVQGSVEDIQGILSGLGIDTNFVQQFFRGSDIEKTRCINCQEVKNLQRCHSIIDRPKLMRYAIEALHSDDMKPIRFKDILVQYIKEHKKCPLYWLCRDCHWEYSKSA